MATASTITNCSNCKRSSDELRFCGNCHTVKYCSRGCQHADWKSHKRTCGFTPTGAPSKPAPASTHAGFNNLKAMLWGGKNDYLHGKPESEVYKLLIDSYRMRVEDECNFQGKTTGIYGGENPVPGFERFLKKAEAREGVLPSWWDATKRDACVAEGSRKDVWSSLHAAVEKSDIQEHYGNNSMPMQLRMLAEEIIGTNVMG